MKKEFQFSGILQKTPTTGKNYGISILRGYYSLFFFYLAVKLITDKTQNNHSGFTKYILNKLD